MSQGVDQEGCLPKTALASDFPALETSVQVDASFAITNVNRVAGTLTGSEITRRFGEPGLSDDTVTLRFNGSAGQSFGAFIPRGMTMILTGDANDYVGKGLSGGKIVVKSPAPDHLFAAGNVIAGNVAFYGATGGKGYIGGRAGERFGVRNSGADIVAEGIGDHGCEYMTGGHALILGDTGKNFAAGMSGGIAYVLPDNHDEFMRNINMEMVETGPLMKDEDQWTVQKLLNEHLAYTGSYRAAYILDHWEEAKSKLIKVIPKDYQRMIELMEEQKQEGYSAEQAAMRAFQLNSQSKGDGVKKESAAMQ